MEFGLYKEELIGWCFLRELVARRFLNMAFRLLRELHYQLSLLERLGFLGNQDSSLIEPKIVETEKVLNDLIRALRDD